MDHLFSFTAGCFYGDKIKKTVVFFIHTIMFSNPKQVFIVPKPNQSTEIITFILMMGSYSFYKEEDLEKLVDFPVSSQPDDEESRKHSAKANQRRFC